MSSILPIVCSMDSILPFLSLNAHWRDFINIIYIYYNINKCLLERFSICIILDDHFMPQTCQEPDGSEWLWKAAWGQQTCPSKSGFLPSLRINSVSQLSSWSVVSSRHSWVFLAFFGECFMSGLHAKHPSHHTQAVIVLGDCSCSLCLPWASSNKYFLCG